MLVRFIIFFSAFLFFSFGADKAPPSLEGRYENNKLSLKIFDKNPLFPNEFLPYLEQGIEFHFTYIVEIKRRKLFSNDEVLTKKIQRKLYYDYWMESYVLRDDEMNVIEYFQSVENLIKRLAQIDEIDFGGDLIKGGEKYRFSVKTQASISNMKGFFYTLFVMYAYLRYGKTYVSERFIEKS